MGDFKTNLSALVEAQRISDSNAGLLKNSEEIPPLEYAFPQKVPLTGATVDLGPKLGCLRWMSQRPTLVHEVRFGGTHYFLALDPLFTAPNASIGVMFRQSGSISEHIILTPGDIIEIPQGFNKFWCYNTSGIQRLQNQFLDGTTGEYGFCRFIASQSRNCLIDFKNGNPHHFANIIYSATLGKPRLGSADGTYTLFPPTNLQRIEARITGYEAGGAAPRKGWSCGIGLFALMRGSPNQIESFMSFPVESSSAWEPQYHWELVDEKVASGIGAFSIWNNVEPNDGHDLIVFDNIPHCLALQIAETTDINSFDANGTVAFLRCTLHGYKNSNGHPFPKVRVIYDADSPDVNTELDSGILSCADLEFIKIFMEPSGVALAAEHILYEVYEDGTEHPIQSVTNAAGALAFTINVGFQFDMIGTVIGAAMDCAGPVPRRIRMHVEALGNDAACHLRITGRTRG